MMTFRYAEDIAISFAITEEEEMDDGVEDEDEQE